MIFNVTRGDPFGVLGDHKPSIQRIAGRGSFQHALHGVFGDDIPIRGIRRDNVQQVHIHAGVGKLRRNARAHGPRANNGRFLNGKLICTHDATPARFLK